MHRLDLGLYSHLKEFWGMELETMLALPEAQRRLEPATLRHAGH